MENRISKITLAACLTMLVGLTGFTGSVMANTPDGETPANEGVCDNLMGATPGLYGLCVAYCEAQDLDMVGEAKMPNSKILANYRKKMQASDATLEPLPPSTGAVISLLKLIQMNPGYVDLQKEVPELRG